jgi:RimJ/RimL family protein N-acetyltransferase
MADESFARQAGERVVLRRFQRADLEPFVAYRTLAEVARFQSWDVPYPLEAGRSQIRQLMRQHPDTPGEWFQFAIALQATGELIGDCGALPLPADARQAEIGFTIAPAHQGRGYGTEAVGVLMGYLFEERRKHRVIATCDARNTASARLLERAGMRREGYLRESTWAKGEWTDDLLYALLDREWQARPGAGIPGVTQR